MSHFLKVLSILIVMVWSSKNLNAADARGADPAAQVFQWLENTGALMPDDVRKVGAKLAKIGADSLHRLSFLTLQDLRNAGMASGAAVVAIRAKNNLGSAKAIPFLKGDDVEGWLSQHDLGRYAQDFKERGFDTLGTICEVTDQDLNNMGMLYLHKRHFFDLQKATKEQK